MMLTVDTIKKQYGDFQLECSMKIPEGRITGFVGPNGAGKSTTIKAILGLIYPDAGTISIRDKNITEMTAKDRQIFGVVLSDSRFSGYFNIKDVVKIMKQMYPRFHEEEFLQRCERFHLPFKKLLKDFSTGQNAMLHVLLAISHEAELLILDEPTAGLDAIVRDEVQDLLRSYMEEESRSILISSHISTDLEGLCDDLYMIQNGKIILHEDTDLLLSSYGVLKVTEGQWKGLDKKYILKRKKDSFGYLCLTNQMQYYLENEKSIVMEKASIDDVLMLMIRGE